MKKLNEYLEHADECRRMARVALPQHRTPLEQMALTWEQLAEVRRRQLAKQSKEPDGADEANTPASEATESASLRRFGETARLTYRETASLFTTGEGVCPAKN